MRSTSFAPAWAVIAICLICSIPGLVLADFRVTNDIYDSTDPGVGVGPDKLARIVWVDNSTGTYQVYWAVFDALGNRILGPIRVSQINAGCSWARIGVDNQNRSFVVWKMSGHIHFARIGVNGTIEVAPKQISSGGSSCETPDLAVSRTGISHVVYRQLSGVIHTMQYRVLDENGTVTCSTTPGNFDIAGVAKYPTVSVDPEGNAYIAWNDMYNFVGGLYQVIYSAACVKWWGPHRIITGDKITRSTICAPRRLWAWTLYQDSRSGVDHIYSYDGVDPGSRVSFLPGPTQIPRMAGANGFPVYVVWQERSSGYWRIMAREWDSTGYLFPDTIQVSDGTGDATLPDIDTDNNGQYYVVWRDTRNGTAEIYMDAVKASGIRVTARVHAEHDNDPFIMPRPPLSGVTVTLTSQGREWPPVVTDNNGMASFAVEMDASAQFRLDLKGPYYDFYVLYNNEPEIHPPSITYNVNPSKNVWSIEWPHSDLLHEGPALQTAYYLEKYRREYWLERLNYSWHLPTRLGKPDNSIEIAIFDLDTDGGRMLSNNGGAMPNSTSTAIQFLRHRSEEADVVYHEYGHCVIGDLFVKHHPPITGTKRVTLGRDTPQENDEGWAMDEAFSDYFAASFTNDPSIVRCGEIIYPYNAMKCRQLRNIDPLFPKKYPANYRHNRYEGSLILSGALWDLRELIEGEGTPQAPVTDRLVFAALDTMIQRKREANPAYKFNDFYNAIKDVDILLFAGQHLDEIEEAFSRHNLTPESPPFWALSWLDDNAIVDVLSDGSEIVLRWLSLPGANSYRLMANLIDWIDYDHEGLPSLGDYVEFASGITDTSFSFQRDPRYSYIFCVVAVDSAHQAGCMSLPVLIDYETAADEKDGAEPNAAECAGRILFVSPNPFNPRTSVHFEMRWSDNVAISIYDASGARVRDFPPACFSAGRHIVSWDGMNNAGRTVSSGIYFVMLKGKNWKDSAKLLMLR